LATTLVAQENKEKELEKFAIAYDHPYKDPYVIVYHKMGNVKVNGNNENTIYVYTQELLPSFNSVFNSHVDMQNVVYGNNYSSQMPIKKKNHMFLITEQDNIVQIETNIFSFNTNVFVEVPNPSSVSVNISEMGSILIENVKGDVEANTMTGDIQIVNTDGVVVANTSFGNILGDFSKKGVNKPLFISALVGNIDLQLPKTSEHNLSLYSEMGSVFSNFQNINQLALARPVELSNNRKVFFPLNGGGTDFVVKTFKGDIYLRH